MRTPIPGGFLVVIEGIDGAGKTTQARLLAEDCARRNLAHAVSKEPTDGRYGAQMRDSAKSGRLSLQEEITLFMLDRREHVATFIKPALCAEKVVILDRYYFSTAAYQGARGADSEAILAANEAFAPEPDLLLLLDLPEQTGLDRIHLRGDQPNAFERHDMLAKARVIFNKIQRPYVIKIDASKDLSVVSKEVLHTFQRTSVNKIAGEHCSPEGINRTLELMGAAPLTAYA